MSETDYIFEIDARRLLCPLPVIRLQNKIKTIHQTNEHSNQQVLIKIYCTDPGTLHDIPTWCRLYGHTVISIEEPENELHFLVKVN